MNITQRHIIHDHNTPHRKRAIAALAGKIDAQDNPPLDWLLIIIVCALILGIGIATGAIPHGIAEATR